MYGAFPLQKIKKKQKDTPKTCNSANLILSLHIQETWFGQAKNVQLANLHFSLARVQEHSKKSLRLSSYSPVQVWRGAKFLLAYNTGNSVSKGSKKWWGMSVISLIKWEFLVTNKRNEMNKITGKMKKITWYEI